MHVVDPWYLVRTKSNKERLVRERLARIGSEIFLPMLKGGPGNICGTENDCGAGIRPDQTGPRVSPVPLARLSQSPGRVGAGLSHPQHFEVAPALQCVKIIKLTGVTAKIGHHFQPAGEPAPLRILSRPASSIANRPNPESTQPVIFLGRALRAHESHPSGVYAGNGTARFGGFDESYYRRCEARIGKRLSQGFRRPFRSNFRLCAL
jgi:hypothetical protein